VNAGFVRERTEASYRVVEGDVDLDGRGYEIFDGLEFGEVVCSSSA